MPLDELRRTFLAEAAETLRTIDMLVARQPDDSGADAAIRRHVHTVKGTCGFLGLPRVEALAHAVEECLAGPAWRRSKSEVAVIRTAIGRMARIVARVDTLHGIEPPGVDGDVLVALEEIGGRADNAAFAGRVSWDGEPVAQTPPVPNVETFLALVDSVADDEVKKTLTRLADIAGRLPLDARAEGMQAIGEIWPLLARAAGELAAAAGKQVFFATEGGDIVADREIAQHLFQPLLQLIRNAIAHGIERSEDRKRAGKPAAGRIALSARQMGSRLIVDVSDDGAGIDPALGGALFTPGFTTQTNPTLLAGRGIGLDIVRERLARIDGLVSFRSTPGNGTTFTLDVPISLSGERLPARGRPAVSTGAMPLAAEA